MRRRVKRRVWAGLCTFLILLMNVFPGVVLATATLPVPQLNPPPNQVPDLRAPQWETPQLEAPEWETPQWDTPQLEAPGWDTPNLQPPGGNVPRLDAPKGTVPALEPPKGTVPELQTPNGTIPHLQTPDTKLPRMEKPGESVPAIKPGTLTPPSPEPFGESIEYDVMKLSFKDVIGGTLGYSAGLIEQGEVDLRTGSGKYGLFLLELGIKVLDIGVKDTPLGNLTGLTIDGLDAKVAFENYKFVLDQRPNSTFGGLDATRSVTNGGASQGAARMPGIVKGLNVGIAAISLPFDAYDTYTKFDQVGNPTLTEDQQNEMFVEGVGSLGSAMMDAGVIAAAIPGGQSVATVLVVTGGVLWGLSRLVKWSDTLSGGAVSRTIRSAVKSTVGWVKSIFG